MPVLDTSNKVFLRTRLFELESYTKNVRTYCMKLEIFSNICFLAKKYCSVCTVCLCDRVQVTTTSWVCSQVCLASSPTQSLAATTQFTCPQRRLLLLTSCLQRQPWRRRFSPTASHSSLQPPPPLSRRLPLSRRHRWHRTLSRQSYRRRLSEDLQIECPIKVARRRRLRCQKLHRPGQRRKVVRPWHRLPRSRQRTTDLILDRSSVIWALKREDRFIWSWLALLRWATTDRRLGMCFGSVNQRDTCKTRM